MKRNTICHVEWQSTNLDRTRKFLEGLFGWEFKEFGDDYLLFQVSEGPGGGISRVETVKTGESPSVYILVDEINVYEEKVKQTGGNVIVPKSEIPTIGWFAHVSDPDGNVIGLFQSNKKC